MYKLSQIAVILMVLFLSKNNFVSAQGIKDTTFIYSKQDTIYFYEPSESKIDIYRSLHFKNKSYTYINNTILSCSICGGKIKESLDTIYFKKKYLIIVQNTDDYSDKLIFRRIQNNFKLQCVVRLTFENMKKKKYSFIKKAMWLNDINYQNLIP
jgi:hypothetical protein